MNEIKNIPKVERRKLTASGSSIILTVPKDWLDENRLKAGQEIMMVMNGDLRFMPITEENITKIRKQLNYNPTGSVITESSKSTIGSEEPTE